MHPSDWINSRKSHGQAITLAGIKFAPLLLMSVAGLRRPPHLANSAGHNDLSRQLWLLRNMLNRSDSSLAMLANLQTLEQRLALGRGDEQHDHVSIRGVRTQRVAHNKETAIHPAGDERRATCSA